MTVQEVEAVLRRFSPDAEVRVEVLIDIEAKSAGGITGRLKGSLPLLSIGAV